MVMRDLELKKKSFKKHLINWVKKEGRNFLWRKRRDPYKVFVAEFLLKRTTSTAAHRVYQNFLEKYPNLVVLSDASITDLENVLKPIGLNKQRAKGVKDAAKYLVESCNNEFPKRFEELIEIPHVGNYTAACILSFGMNISAPAIDSNGQRILSRVFKNSLENNASLKKVFDFSWELLPKKDHVLFNYGLIDLGALICTYRSCSKEKCPLKGICDYYSDIN
jgi:A/G-specific adenine glycosylase